MPKQRPVAAEVVALIVATSASPKGGAAPRPGPLAEQLDLHRQLPDVTLRRVEHLRHGLAVTIL